MSKFNQKTACNHKPNAVSYEGGEVYEKNPVEEWMNFIFSSYMQDGFYESAQEQQDRFTNLTEQIVEEYGPEFAAKCAIFSRNELGLRSVSTYVAALLNKYQFDRKRDFYGSFFRRPDDVAECFSVCGKRSHALVRGAKDYLEALSGYTIGKYKMNGKQYNMYDLINITHANSVAINAYKDGTLTTPDTWEVSISGAESEEKKNEEWLRMLNDRKLGYLALLRNIRNILKAIDAIGCQLDIMELCDQLTNPISISNSLVFPYQIYTAAKMVSNPKIQSALEDAFIIACGNVPELQGDTAVILDVSGSMGSKISSRSDITIKECGAVYAAMMLIKNKDVDFIKFGNKAKNTNYNIMIDGVFNTISKMQKNEGLGYGTEISAAFEMLNKHYNRIFIISDMQVMDEPFRWSDSGQERYEDYRKEYGISEVYSFDLGNYPTQVADPKRKEIHMLTSLSSKVFDILRFIEDGESLVKYIEDYCKY